MKRPFKSLLFSLTVTQILGCSQFVSHRDYLSEMDQEDSRYFNPRQDFPVVAGDTGRSWATDKEILKRTPASSEDLATERNRLSLEQELNNLEHNLSSTEHSIYQKYRHKLMTTSERIYYLKLPHHDRNDYLVNRGFVENSPSRSPAREVKFGLRSTEIALGMSKEDVKHSWGHPSRVEVAGNPSYENERWLYERNGATKYIYFESGRVEGWE
jgi:hypothetical protein